MQGARDIALWQHEVRCLNKWKYSVIYQQMKGVTNSQEEWLWRHCWEGGRNVLIHLQTSGKQYSATVKAFILARHWVERETTRELFKWSCGRTLKEYLIGG